MKRTALTLVLAAILSASPAHAESLRDALVKAYNTNPQLKAAQAQVRATDEGVAVALSGLRPTATGNASVGLLQTSRADEALNGGNSLQPKSGSISVNQPLFRGFRTMAGISAAKADVKRVRAALMQAEQDLLVDAATAYVNVYRDQAIAALRKHNETVLMRQLEGTRDRFRVGEVTRTDVSQSESRLARAASDRVQADGNLEISKANYQRLIGDQPAMLTKPEIQVPVPKTLGEAIEMAQYNSPSVEAAEHAVDTAKNQIRVARGALMPEVNLTGSMARAYDQSFTGLHRVDTQTIGATLTMPLYEAGADYARTRAAKQTAGQRQMELSEALNRARETAIRAWQLLTSAQSEIQSRTVQVNAAELALEGVRQEANVGTRTTLDVLDAEQELLDAKVSMVTAESAAMVAVFQTHSAVGQMTADALKLPVATYNPQTYYDDNAGKWIGLGE